MCVASFLTKSGSSTPATWVLVVVHADGLLEDGPLLAGPPPVAGPPLSSTPTPPLHRRRHMICASSWWRICATAASCTDFSTAGQPCTAGRDASLAMLAGCGCLPHDAASASAMNSGERSM